MSDIAITGIGVISSMGIGREAFWETCKKAGTGIKKVRDFETSSFASNVAGGIDDFEPRDYMPPRIYRRMSRLPIKWSCYANPEFVTPELVDLMLAAGCTGLEFGSDAANATMLENMGKNFTVNDLERASDICRQSGINFCHSLLLGGPGETMETVNQTLEAILNMSPTAAICMIGIRIFPKTKLALMARKEGMIGPDEDFLKPVFYLSPDVKNEILPFIKTFSKKHPTWIFPGLNININAKLQKNCDALALKAPYGSICKSAKGLGEVDILNCLRL